MKIEHLAIWVKDLEEMKNFYTKYFGMDCGEKYVNKSKNFSSYFLSFKGSSTRIELMHRIDILGHVGKKGAINGLAHFAISVGNKERVIELTTVLDNDNFIVTSKPRTTGDCYFESVILDPEGNHLEITE